MRTTKTTYILIIILVVLSVFIKSLENDFVWDDHDLVISNPYVKSFDWMPQIFTEQLYNATGHVSNFYRPIQLVSYAVDYSVWKLNPYGYHLTNLLFHISNSILLYLILFLTGVSPPIGLFTSLLFGVAPMISGITFYIAARSDLMAMCFIFLSVLCLLRYTRMKKTVYYFISLLFFICSLLSKEMAIIFPFLLVLILTGLRARGKSLSYRYLIPYFLVQSIYVAARAIALNFTGINILNHSTVIAALPLHVRLLTDIEVLARYVLLFLVPYPLHMQWFIRPIYSLLDIRLLIYSLILVFFGIMIRKLYLKNKIVLFGALWFIITLLPVLNIYPVSYFFGEGWLYLPSIGIFLIMSVFFVDVIGARFGINIRNILFAVFMLYYSLFTIAYSRAWKDPISVFHNVIKYEKDNPSIFKIYNNLATAYYIKKDYHGAVGFGKKSIAHNPDFKEAYNNLGVVYAVLNKRVEAIRHFKEAIRLDKGYDQAYCNLSRAYHDMGLDDKALMTVKELLSINPDSYLAHFTLGFTHSLRGEKEDAVYEFNRAKSIRPYYYEPYLCIGDIYIEQKRFEEALREYEKVSPLVVVDSNYYDTLAFLYKKNQRYEEAEKALRNASALSHKDE